jgi:hypothetical protein
MVVALAYPRKIRALMEWAEAGTHEAENIDKTASRMFIVEIKDANWKPSTG